MAIKRSPWSAPVDHLDLAQAVDGLGQRIVVTVSDVADGRFDPRLRQTLGAADGDVLESRDPNDAPVRDGLTDSVRGSPAPGHRARNPHALFG